MRLWQHGLLWHCAALFIGLALLPGQCIGQVAPAPGSTTQPSLVSRKGDWTDLREPVTQKPVTPADLSVPLTGVQLGIQLMQMAGPSALATDDIMEVMRSVLAQVLPVTYSDVDPQAYKNVSVCPVVAPAPAPLPAQQNPGTPGQASGRRRLQASSAWARELAELVDGTPDKCTNKMRAVFMLRRSLGTDATFNGNASYVQKTVRDAFYSGFLLARTKRSKINVDSLDLLVYQNGGTAGVLYPSGEALEGEAGSPAASPGGAPSPSIGAAAQWALAHPAAQNTTVDVFFTLILTGPDAVETNASMIKRLSFLLTDILNTGDIDYLTDDNTAVVYEEQLPPLTVGNASGRRLLLSGPRDEIMEVGSEVAPLSESEQRAMAAWLKKGRHGRRADRNAHADHVLFRRLLQAQPPQPPMAGPPTRAPTLLNTGPVNALSITYRVNSIAQPGPAVIAEKLGYFIQTGQAVQLMQQTGFQIGNIELGKFSPLPGLPEAGAPSAGPVGGIAAAGPTPAPSGPAAAAPAPGFAATLGNPQLAQAGALKLGGKIVLGVVFPVSLLAIVAAVTFAYLFFKYKRRYAASERPIKDSAQDMENSDSKSLPISSGSGGIRSSSSQPRSGSGGIRNIVESMSTTEDVSGQEALHMASLAKKSLTLPGMQSDWEIDPDELEIAKKKDGSEWRLGTGASAHVYKAFRNGVQVVAVKIFTDQVPGENQARYAEAFRREIFILRSCHDRNIVQFLGACLQVGQTILVQEYMENGDLFHAISEDMSGRFGWYRKKNAAGKPIPHTGMARRIALDTARGLFFLHSRKIVHFDLKSANVLLGRDWTAKIADVGLAKILKDGWLSTLREVGTFSWAAPEVLLGKPCTEKVDIYSYGVLLWELSAGEAPPGRNLRPLRVPEECPADVEAMIARCLDSDPDKRPSARELVDFMLQLPQQLSLEGTASCSDWSSYSGSNSSQLLSHGASLPPMTPRQPPGGMVLPNAFGLMSMKSFKRSSSGQKGPEPGISQPGSPAASDNLTKAKTPKSTPGSAFRSLKSMSFKKKPTQGGLETTVEESDASLTRELERAVSNSNRSFKEAAEGRRTAISPAAATAAAAHINGDDPPRKSDLESQKSVRFMDDSTASAAASSSSAKLSDGTSRAARLADIRSTLAPGGPARSALDSRDSASEVANARSASATEPSRPGQPGARKLPMSSAFAQDGAQQRAPSQQQQWRLPFMSAFAVGEEESAGASLPLEQNPSEKAEQTPSTSMPSAEEPASAGPQSQPAQVPRRPPIPSAFADAAGSPSQPEQALQRPPVPSAFTAGTPEQSSASSPAEGGGQVRSHRPMASASASEEPLPKEGIPGRLALSSPFAADDKTAERSHRGQD